MNASNKKNYKNSFAMQFCAKRTSFHQIQIVNAWWEIVNANVCYGMVACLVINRHTHLPKPKSDECFSTYFFPVSLPIQLSIDSIILFCMQFYSSSFLFGKCTSKLKAFILSFSLRLFRWFLFCIKYLAYSRSMRCLPLHVYLSI